MAVMDQDAAVSGFSVLKMDAIYNGKIKVSGIRNVFKESLVCLKVD